MKNRWLAACTSAVLLTAALGGCGQKHVQLDEQPILNYTAPAQGDEIVVIHVRDYGDITVRLFPELLPEACENFLELARAGYYDELIFHRVMENFMIQGGDPKGDGTGGESTWGGHFDGGWNEQLIHVPGALAYANSEGTATDGSQFYIVTGDAVPESMLNSISENSEIYFTQEARALYQQYGGTPWLDGGNYTVFGQVIDGLDVAFEISHTAVDAETAKPKKAVYMDSVTVEQYDGSEIRWYPADYGLE